MMEVIAYAAIAYLFVRLLVSLVNLSSRLQLKKGEFSGNHLVSILIPARNEELAIGRLLDDLKEIRYDNLEILVYDDDSTDQTRAVIMSKSMIDKRIHYLKGKELLPGWLGKNHACHQLARVSKGGYLLFLDADVRIIPQLLTDAIAMMERKDLDLLSLFPVQKMNTLGEWLTVPLMNRILLGNLPLILVRKSRLPDFAAANGQFMMFKAETYKRHWFHKQVNNEKVEDIRIIRLMKFSKYKVQTLLSAGQVSCRMYSGFADGLNGFSKNVHAFFGNNWIILFLYVALTTLGPLAVLISLTLPAFFIYMAGLILFVMMVSVQSRQSWWLNIILGPIQQVSLVLVSVLAAYRHLTGRLYWKGRRL